MGAKKMGVRLQKLKKAEFLIECNDNHGIIQETLDKIKVSRYYYDQWLNNDPVFNLAVAEMPAKTKAFVESKLFKLIREGNPASIFFWLKCQGGYIETQHIKQENSYTKPLTINVIAPHEEPLRIEGEEQKKLNE